MRPPQQQPIGFETYTGSGLRNYGATLLRTRRDVKLTATGGYDFSI